MKYQYVGSSLTLIGSALSLIGALVNNLWLDHRMAMLIWMASNPLLFIWSLGNYRRWWDGGLSILALCVMYGVFTASNLWGLLAM